MALIMLTNWNYTPIPNVMGDLKVHMWMIMTYVSNVCKWSCSILESLEWPMLYLNVQHCLYIIRKQQLIIIITYLNRHIYSWDKLTYVSNIHIYIHCHSSPMELSIMCSMLIFLREMLIIMTYIHAQDSYKLRPMELNMMCWDCPET